MFSAPWVHTSLFLIGRGTGSRAGREEQPHPSPLALASCSSGNVSQKHGERSRSLWTGDLASFSPKPPLFQRPVVISVLVCRVGGMARCCPLSGPGTLLGWLALGQRSLLGTQVKATGRPGMRWHLVPRHQAALASGPPGCGSLWELCILPAVVSSSVQWRQYPLSERAGVRTTRKRKVLSAVPGTWCVFNKLQLVLSSRCPSLL